MINQLEQTTSTLSCTQSLENTTMQAFLFHIACCQLHLPLSRESEQMLWKLGQRFFARSMGSCQSLCTQTRTWPRLGCVRTFGQRQKYNFAGGTSVGRFVLGCGGIYPPHHIMSDVLTRSTHLLRTPSIHMGNQT